MKRINKKCKTDIFKITKESNFTIFYNFEDLRTFLKLYYILPKTPKIEPKYFIVRFRNSGKKEKIPFIDKMIEYGDLEQLISIEPVEIYFYYLSVNKCIQIDSKLSFDNLIL